MSVAPDVTWKLRDLLDIEFERQDHDLMETMQRLTITEKNEKIGSDPEFGIKGCLIENIIR